MSGRRPWMPWLAAVVIGHAAGSYAVELMDALDNYGMQVPVAERLAAPVRCLPILVAWTYRSAHGTGPAPADVRAWWVVYAVPFAAVLAVAPLGSCLARRRRARPQGFAPILSADRVGPDRQP